MDLSSDLSLKAIANESEDSSVLKDFASVRSYVLSIPISQN